MAYMYRRVMTDGSEAYDLTIGERERVTPRKAARHTAKQAKTSVTAFGVAMAFAVVFVLVLQLFAQQRLYESKTQVAVLQREYNELTEQQGKLRSEYESKINFAAIEAQAARLGMSKPTGAETVYINLSGEDRGEVLATAPTTLTALARLTDDAFANLEAYLAQPES